MAMTHLHTQTQVQRLVGSKDRVETNGRKDRWTLPIALPTRLTLSVNIQCVTIMRPDVACICIDRQTAVVEVDAAEEVRAALW